jgi:hypothetical protein
MSAGDTSKRYRPVAFLALVINVLVASLAIGAGIIVSSFAFAFGWPSLTIAAVLLDLGAILLVWDAIAIERQARRGPMPVAMSSQRPLGLVALVAIAIASAILHQAFVGIISSS